MNTRIVCARCGKRALKATGGVRRSWRKGAPVYCGRKCAGLARRIGKTKAQKVAEKKIYDAQYRLRDPDALKARKHAYHLRTYDPGKEAIKRKKRMPRHVEYCRQPEYKAWKREYDRRLRASEYGPFADCFLMLRDLDAEIATRMSRYDIYVANGTLNKRLQRRREYESFVSGQP